MLIDKVMVEVRIKKLNTYEYIRLQYIKYHPHIIKYGGHIVMTLLGIETSIGEINNTINTTEPNDEQIDEVVKTEKKTPLSQKIRNMKEPKGLEGRPGEILEKGRDLAYRTSVDVGKGVGKVAKGLREGFAYENKDVIADAVEAAENIAQKDEGKKDQVSHDSKDVE